MSRRADGLTYPTFWVIQLFDSEGYYTSLVADLRHQVIWKATDYTHNEVRQRMVAASLPFEGKWIAGEGCLSPDVSLPPDWKTDLASVDKPSKGE